MMIEKKMNLLFRPQWLIAAVSVAKKMEFDFQLLLYSHLFTFIFSSVIASDAFA